MSLFTVVSSEMIYPPPARFSYFDTMGRDRLRGAGRGGGRSILLFPQSLFRVGRGTVAEGLLPARLPLHLVDSDRPSGGCRRRRPACCRKLNKEGKGI